MTDQYNPEPKVDSWFNYKGAVPPKRTPHLTRKEIDEELANNLQGHTCDWKQKGNEIYCEAGDFRHGKMIDPKQRLVFENGKPRLVAMAPIYRDTESKVERLQKKQSRVTARPKRPGGKKNGRRTASPASR